jgi:hypothetical protein
MRGEQRLTGLGCGCEPDLAVRQRESPAGNFGFWIRTLSLVPYPQCSAPAASVTGNLYTRSTVDTALGIYQQLCLRRITSDLQTSQAGATPIAWGSTLWRIASMCNAAVCSRMSNGGDELTGRRAALRHTGPRGPTGDASGRRYHSTAVTCRKQDKLIRPCDWESGNR